MGWMDGGWGGGCSGSVYSGLGVRHFAAVQCEGRGVVYGWVRWLCMRSSTREGRGTVL